MTTSQSNNSRMITIPSGKHTRFRQLLVLATLSQRSVRITEIGGGKEGNFSDFGLRDYEASFLRLLEKLTNGSTIQINHTGTTVTYHPGLINGGEVKHDCPPSRAIGYFLEPLIALAPFAKTPLRLTLTGITNDNVDVSVDLIRTVLLPQLVRFGVEDTIELKVNKRGAAPLGGGQVYFTCPILRALKPLQFTDVGLIKRIRGIAYATRISPQMANRVVDAARSILTKYIPNVYLYTDVYKGGESGLSPGYALSLVAESTTGVLICTECAYQPKKKEVLLPNLNNNDGDVSLPKDQARGGYEGEGAPSSMLVSDYTFPTPEDLGVRAARQLLVEIKKSGTVDSISQWLNILFLALGPEDVGKIRVGSLTPFTIQYLRDIQKFLGVTFKMTPERSSRTVILATVGTGFTNVNKKVT